MTINSTNSAQPSAAPVTVLVPAHLNEELRCHLHRLGYRYYGYGADYFVEPENGGYHSYGFFSAKCARVAMGWLGD